MGSLIRRVAAITFLLSSSVSAQLVFDDGGQHVLTGVVTDIVQVSNQSLLKVEAERLERPLVVDNSQVDFITGVMQTDDLPGITLSNHAVLNLLGGAGQEVRLTDSQINVYEGGITGKEGEVAIDAAGESTVRVHGGSVAGGTLAASSIRLREESQLFMVGGQVSADNSAIALHDFSKGIMTAGGVLACHEDFGSSTAIKLYDNSSLTLAGGEIQCWREGPTGVSVFGDAQFLMTGGKISSRGEFAAFGIETSERGQAAIRGGDVFIQAQAFPPMNPRNIVAYDASTITLYGRNFNYPLGPIGDLEGTVTGTLADGSAFDWLFVRHPTARIVLVPEPSSLPLAMLGGLLLTTLWKTRWDPY